MSQVKGEAPSIECRGRNGWFTFHEFRVLDMPRHGEIFVEFWAKKQGENAPVMITGPAEKIKDLFRQIHEKLEKE